MTSNVLYPRGTIVELCTDTLHVYRDAAKSRIGLAAESVRGVVELSNAGWVGA